MGGSFTSHKSNTTVWLLLTEKITPYTNTTNTNKTRISLFKKAMLTRFGFDARLTTGYSPYNYHPLIGQFFLQNEQSLSFTPLIDVFLNFKVKTFRFFFKVESLMPYLTERYYFQTASYPLPYGWGNGGVRFGVNWRLVD